jgi:alpha-1,4-N-acetylglucosaminyltransferase EXTL3
MPLKSYVVIRHALKSPIGFLLTVAIAFGIVILIMQFFLGAHLNATQSYRLAKEQSEWSTEQFINAFPYEYEKCRKMIELNLDISDLKRMRNSYLSELKQIELKRRSSLRALNNLKAKLDSLRIDFDQLEHKRARLSQSLAADLLQKAELEFNIRKKLILMEKVDKSNLIFGLLSKEERNSPANTHAHLESQCLMNDCFNFARCSLNAKLSIYLFELSNSQLAEAISNEQIERSFRIVSNSNQACIIFAELIQVSTKTRNYYKKLASFIIENSKNKMNLLLIDTTGDDISYILSHLNSLFLSASSDKQEINRLIHTVAKSTTLASFTHNIYNQSSSMQYFSEFIHFSLISQPVSSVLPPMADSIRQYLLSYHRSSSSVEIKHILSEYLSSHTSMSIELECSQDTNPSYRFMCYNRNKREETLCKSSFVLLLSDLGYWSLESTHRLIEALRCMSIPVLLEPSSRLRLPLDELIEWDELVIRLPMARIGHLASILASISEQDLLERRIKAKSLYEAYFSSHVAQLNTLGAALMHRMRLPAVSIPEYKLQKFMPPDDALNHPNGSSGFVEDSKPSVDYNQNNEEESEYLGPVNQPAMESESFLFNYTRSRYILWNRLFYPFNSFPSTPFDPVNRNEPSKWLLEFARSEELIKMSNSSVLGGGDGTYMSHVLGGSVASEQFTIVILAYEREPVLINSLERYVRLPYLNRIVIVWNGEKPPSIQFARKFALHMHSSRMHVLLARNNSLNSRFLPFDLMATDAVLSMDDDTLLRNDEIIMAFRVWRENRDRIVGFPARYHTWSTKARNYVYESYLSCEYSMILTGAAFYHRFYHFAYTYMMAPSVRSLVDQMSNCEDIAFNMLVSHLTRKPPLKVTAKWNFYCAQCENLNKINSDNPSLAANASDAEHEQRVPISMRKSHYAKRTECIRYISSILAYNPLLYSQYRADSVLYRTKLPTGKQKCFKLV